MAGIWRFNGSGWEQGKKAWVYNGSGWVEGKKAWTFDGNNWIQRWNSEILVDVTATNHNFNPGDLHAMMLAAAGGSWPTGTTFIITIHQGVQLVSMNETTACIWLGGAIAQNNLIRIINHGHILGRGGRGNGAESNGRVRWGSPGGPAIICDAAGGVMNVEIANYGVIGGGGGGGAGDSNDSVTTIMGGGGAPFGAGGLNGDGSHGSNGKNASYDVPGAPSRAGTPNQRGGSGGGWGLPGGGGFGYGRPVPPQPPGAAVIVTNGSGFGWIARGDIRGSAP